MSVCLFICFCPHMIVNGFSFCVFYLFLFLSLSVDYHLAFALHFFLLVFQLLFLRFFINLSLSQANSIKIMSVCPSVCLFLFSFFFLFFCLFVALIFTLSVRPNAVIEFVQVHQMTQCFLHYHIALLSPLTFQVRGCCCGTAASQPNLAYFLRMLPEVGQPCNQILIIFVTMIFYNSAFGPGSILISF